MLFMRNREYRCRLIVRRTIICVCLSIIISLIAAGGVAIVRGIHIEKGNTKQKIESSADSINSERSPPALTSSAQSATIAPQSSKAVPVKPEGYFDDAVFIGDSRTEGLRNYDGLGDASYYAVKGLMINTISTEPAITINGVKMTVMQALKQKKYNKVFIMLGINELGWSSSKTFFDDYIKVIDQIKKDQPGTKIYVQAILPVTAKKSESDKVYNNKQINYYNRQLQKMAEKEGVHFLEVDRAVSNQTGCLPESASTDGIHLNNEYCKKWCEYLKAHV